MKYAPSVAHSQYSVQNMLLRGIFFKPVYYKVLPVYDFLETRGEKCFQWATIRKQGATVGCQCMQVSGGGVVVL